MNQIETVRAFLRSLEDRNLDRALSLASADVVYQNVPLPPARGAREFEKQMRFFEKVVDRFEARIHHIAADGNVVLTERTDIIERGGMRLSFWVCGTFEVRDERIALWRDYFDWAALSVAFLRGLPRMAIHPITTRLRSAKPETTTTARS
jgi:limonene-1,2-epoxide hydrolase